MIFKDVFRNALLTMDLEFVSKKMANNNIMIMTCIMILFSFIVRGMNKNTKDLAYAHKKTEELLDQQKTFIFSFSPRASKPSQQSPRQLAAHPNEHYLRPDQDHGQNIPDMRLSFYCSSSTTYLISANVI